MEKKFWKVAICVVMVLLSLNISSCSDDEEEPVGSTELLLGTWTGIYYLEQVWEDGEFTGDNKEDFVNGTNRFSIEFRADGTYIEREVYVPSGGSIRHSRGTWTYSGNKLTMIDNDVDDDDNYTEVWTVTKMTENELLYEQRGKEKEDGTTYEYLEQHAFKR